MLDVVVESVLCLCFYNKNLHYIAVAHQQRISSTTLSIPFESSFAKTGCAFLCLSAFCRRFLRSKEINALCASHTHLSVSDLVLMNKPFVGFS
jgi:hypothetical protein